MLRIGVIGIGNMGSEHCRILKSGAIPEAELTAVADLRAVRRAWAAEQLPGVAVFDHAEELIASGQCDAVIVAVPHPAHPQVTAAALEGGLHVLCEKPIAVSTAEAHCMTEAAERCDEWRRYCQNDNKILTKRSKRAMIYLWSK